MRNLLIIFVLILVIGVGAFSAKRYNLIVGADEEVNASEAQVENVLQRRYDLIPNLVKTVQGFADQEKDVLTEITKARGQWQQASGGAEKAEASGQLEGALGRLMVAVEKYPELRSNENFTQLQYQLEGTENRVAVERQRYNESIRNYNSVIRQFPTNVVAGVTGFGEKTGYFESVDEAGSVPEVSFK